MLYIQNYKYNTKAYMRAPGIIQDAVESLTLWEGLLMHASMVKHVQTTLKCLPSQLEIRNVVWRATHDLVYHMD